MMANSNGRPRPPEVGISWKNSPGLKSTIFTVANRSPKNPPALVSQGTPWRVDWLCHVPASAREDGGASWGNGGGAGAAGRGGCI